MAHIERHPRLDDPFIEMSLTEIEARRGVADIFEEGKVILLKDYRLPVDFPAIASLGKSTDSIADPDLRKKLKKLTSTSFFEGRPPIETKGTLRFHEPLRQAVFDVLCNSDPETFRAAAKALKLMHEQVLRLFDLCFPDYEAFRLVPSIRLTRTMFENLHWDNHSIADDFHQARIFANLDTRPRIWNISSSFPDFVRDHYGEYDLGRFAGKDPNLMIDYIAGAVLGGTRNTWMDHQPRHRIAFDPGEVWLGESRLISHQIYYGEAAMVYMWFVTVKSMYDPAHRFNHRVEDLHRRMAAGKRIEREQSGKRVA